MKMKGRTVEQDSMSQADDEDAVDSSVPSYKESEFNYCTFLRLQIRMRRGVSGNVALFDLDVCSRVLILPSPNGCISYHNGK